VIFYGYAELTKSFGSQYDSLFVLAKADRELLYPQADLVWGFLFVNQKIILILKNTKGYAK